MDKPLNPPNIDLTEAERRFGFVNAKSKNLYPSGTAISTFRHLHCQGDGGDSTSVMRPAHGLSGLGQHGDFDGR